MIEPYRYRDIDLAGSVAMGRHVTADLGRPKAAIGENRGAPGWQMKGARDVAASATSRLTTGWGLRL